MSNTFTPNYAFHPGESLYDTMQRYNMELWYVEKMTKIKEERLKKIINKEATIKKEEAAAFEKLFGISKEYWLNMQKHYNKIQKERRDAMPQSEITTNGKTPKKKNELGVKVYYHEIEEKDFLYHPFSQHYIEWITEHVKGKFPKALIKFINHDKQTNESTKVIIASIIHDEVCSIATFLGYAWGQQENGR